MTKKPLSIEIIFKGYRPKPLNNYANRWNSKCVFDENHTDGSGQKSFYFDAEENWYHCFSCKESGSFSSLLNKMGVSAFDILELVNFSFESVEDVRVDKSPNKIILPIKTSEYYLGRGFSSKLLKRFKIVQESVTLKSGDRVVEHIIPSIQNNLVVGYEAFYLLPSGIKERRTSDGYQKSEYLYNFNPELEEAFMVEGPADTLRLTSYGEDVISTWGTNLSEKQVQIIKESKLKTLILCADNDLAGFLANELWYRQLNNVVDCKFIFYPSEDPDKCSLFDWELAQETICDYLTYSITMYDLYGDDYEAVVTQAEKLWRKRKYN